MQLVALERLLSIEGADEIRIDVTFLRGKAPLPGELSAKLTERLHQICHDLSVSASPMRGSCRRKATDEVGAVAQMRCLHLIRHGSAVPPSPHRGRLWCSKNRKSSRKKVQPDKFRLHLLFTAKIPRQLLSNLIPTYQAARTKTPVR